MSDDDRKDTAPLLVLIGALLLVAGLWMLMGRFFEFPPVLQQIWQRVRSADEAVALIIIGAAIVMFAQRKEHPGMPAKGTRLYRSRSEKWVGGVLGGLARYFSVDVTVLRLAFIALAFLLDIGGIVVAYIVLWIVVPEEPEGVSAAYAPTAPAPYAAPVWPAAPPAPPAPEQVVPPVPEWPEPPAWPAPEPPVPPASPAE